MRITKPTTKTRKAKRGGKNAQKQPKYDAFCLLLRQKRKCGMTRGIGATAKM